jgi:hypothetical protein
MFPSKYLKVEDLEGEPAVLKITESETQNLKDFNDGKMKPKTVLGFEGTDKILVLSAKVNWDSCAKITGCQDSDDWVGHSIEVYPDETPVGGEMKPCIRIRAPQKPQKQKASPPPKKFPPDRISSGLPKKVKVLPKQEEPPEDDPDDPGFSDDDIHDEAAE